MAKIIKMTPIIVVLFILLGLQACSQKTTPEENLYTILESVVTLEDAFEEQQAPLVTLEEKEKALYDQIISLGMKEYDQIVTLSNEALSLVKEREERIHKEKESIEASREHFKKSLSNIDKLEDESLKKEAKGLYTLMEKRYQAYDELYKHYTTAIEYDRELYQMFQKEDITLDMLETQIEKINQTYEKVMEDNNQFNEYTKKYNQAKLTFYKHSGLDIESGDDTES